jgi:hypothetical protein
MPKYKTTDNCLLSIASNNMSVTAMFRWNLFFPRLPLWCFVNNLWFIRYTDSMGLCRIFLINMIAVKLIGYLERFQDPLPCERCHFCHLPHWGICWRHQGTVDNIRNRVYLNLHPAYCSIIYPQWNCMRPYINQHFLGQVLLKCLNLTWKVGFLYYFTVSNIFMNNLKLI